MHPIPRLTLPAVALLTAIGSAVHAQTAAQELEQMRVDCRAEGEAVGLEGGALDSYIRDCVTDLQGVELLISEDK